ncbi:L-2-amino-thiazoline-4-carboxylic acid hydrolase [Stappia sp. F7233]|uniref:L-2-amino-thiazoline-4-carboxylic acid hydrolase n=1 Tax=Stappia albiluteola TaxID=2758565 RepID=A0A839AHF1_9HYPH|nr:L-2-amino-thiazoline-4-carboxylic acid hydrolase [Stappia albiluteola]MBA5777939.1 L-2-amino-thiazoline-4-carboxylic acid hydrolase [Stappia albiluteola]
MTDVPLKDTLTERLGVLTRRETEARILIPVIEAMAEAFGKEEVHAILRKTIVEIARRQGKALADDFGADSAAFLETLQFWTKDNALEIETLRDDGRHLDFNVTRCRYAEMYRALGIPELGAILSCNRDFALIEGFNEDAKLTREQTIMQGAPCCTFRYDFGVGADDKPA